MNRLSKKKQEWVCGGCGLSGTATYDPERGDVLSVLRAIRDQHETLASKYAPLCHFDVDRVRVRNDAEMDVYKWNRLVRKIEEGCGRVTRPGRMTEHFSPMSGRYQDAKYQH